MLLTLCAPLTAKTIAGPWSPSEWVAAVHEDHGVGRVVDPGNLSGWCTWFSRTRSHRSNCLTGAPVPTTPRCAPRRWITRCPGAWWFGAGRWAAATAIVGFVTDVDVEPGTFDVWDANFSVGWDRRIRWRRTATNDRRILGFICPPEFREPDAELVQPVESAYDIAFVREGNLFLYRFSDRRVRPLTRGGGVSHPAWTPDGASLVFAQRGRIRRLDLATGDLTTLTTSTTCAQPAVRDDGRVWFVRLLPDATGNPKRADLWAMDLDGGQAQRLGMVCERPESAGVAPTMVGRTRWSGDGRQATVEVWAEAGPALIRPRWRAARRDRACRRGAPRQLRAELPGRSRGLARPRRGGPGVPWRGGGVADAFAGRRRTAGGHQHAERARPEQPDRRLHVDAGAVYDVLDDAAQPAWSPSFGGLDKLVAVSSVITTGTAAGTVAE
ncbi:MAG: hypothetical protein M5U09_18035 [Gammaproteobacteria bacterium]|nr:hypothetical protein [Gammaproteobacteria bacterium]